MAHKTAFLEKKLLNRLLRRTTTAVSGSNASTSNILVTSSTGFDPGDLVKLTTAGSYHTVTAIPDGTHITVSPALGAAPTTGNVEAWGYSPPAVYVALFTAAPTDAGGGTEATGGSYARVQMTQADGTWDAPSGTPSNTQNTGVITFPTSSGAWSSGTALSHFGLMDSSSGGNLLAWNALNVAQTVSASGVTPSFAAGDLDWSED